jgi:hypothetical protein
MGQEKTRYFLSEEFEEIPQMMELSLQCFAAVRGELSRSHLHLVGFAAV